MILEDQLNKAAASDAGGLFLRAKQLYISAAAGVENHPGVAVIAGIASSLVAVMQSAQEVVATLIALVTSIGGLVVAVMAVRAKWKNRNKE